MDRRTMQGGGLDAKDYLAELRSRRALLKGLGLGALMFAPLMRTLSARAAGQGSPKLLIMSTPNGFHMPRMTVKTAGAGSPNPDAPVFEDSLSPLKALAAEVLVMKNLTSTLDTDGFQPSHEQQSALLTGFSTKMNNGNKHYQLAQGPSIDWILAKRLGQEPLGLSVFFDPYTNYKHLWSDKNIPNDPVNDPRVLLDKLFPGTGAAVPAPTTGGLSTAKAEERCNLVKDALVNDAKILHGRLGVDDRPLLAPYLESLEGLRCSMAAPPPPRAQCVRPAIDPTIRWTEKADWRRRALAHLSVIMAAFKCGYRDVATLSFAYGVSGPNVHALDVKDHHNWSHTNEHKHDPLQTIVHIDTAYAQFYADMIVQMKDAGLLDDVAILWISEIVDGNGHNQDKRQWLLAGGGAGRLRKGHVVDATGVDNDRSLNRLCVALANMMGHSITTFGDTARHTAGPLPGLLV